MKNIKYILFILILTFCLPMIVNAKSATYTYKRDGGYELIITVNDLGNITFSSNYENSMTFKNSNIKYSDYYQNGTFKSCNDASISKVYYATDNINSTENKMTYTVSLDSSLSNAYFTLDAASCKVDNMASAKSLALSCNYDVDDKKFEINYYSDKSLSGKETTTGKLVIFSAEMKDTLPSECPRKIYYAASGNNFLVSTKRLAYGTGATESSSGGSGNTGASTGSSGSSYTSPIYQDASLNFCVQTSAIWQYIGYLLIVVKILIPLVIIILGIIDFVKSITTIDPKGLVKAIISLVKRVIMGVLIFILPSLVSYVFSLVGESSEYVSRGEACQVCLLKPNSDSCQNYKATAAENRKAYNN